MVLLRYNERIHIFLTCCIAFLIPAFPPIIAPVIVLLGLNWLLIPKAIFPGLKSILKEPSLIMMIALYLLYLIVIGHWYNTDKVKLNLKWISIIVLLMIFILLLSSKAGWTGLFLFAIYFFIGLLKKRKVLSGIVMIGALIGSFWFLNIHF